MFCTPDEGLFMSSSSKAEGPWEPLVLVKGIAGWEDPCPFWDDNGTGYPGHSKVGAGPIIIHKLSPDGKQLLDDGVTVYTGPVAEGTKIHKLNDYYYLSIPEGGVERGWQTVLRSKTIFGPYEKNTQFNQFGESFIASAGFWKGTRIGLFSYNENNESGSAAFNWFTYNYDVTKSKKLRFFPYISDRQ